MLTDELLDLTNISPNHEYALLRPTEKFFLDHCAKNLKNDSIVVEIGTFLGGAASILAHSNPKIKIFSIDQYDDYNWDPNQKLMIDKASNGQLKVRTLELVKKINERYNIEFLSGTSPYDFFDWSHEIDLYIEDGTHSGQILFDNINFWTKKIKVGGYVFLHDYRPYLNIGHELRFIDVEQSFMTLLNEGNFVFNGFYGDYAALKRVK